MEKYIEKYFLAANSCEGFYSRFAESYDADLGWRAFLIKGGPGTGKSSFLKFVASKAQGYGLRTILCPCSSDPLSLDAVIIPEKRIVIMDATAPHTIEPIYPAACEEILNFGRFWDNKQILKNRNEIIETTRANKLIHEKVGATLRAAGELIYDNYKTALASTDIKKAERFALSLAKKYIPYKKKNSSYEWVRFIEGITPMGIVYYRNTIDRFYNNKIIISDEFGSASSIIISTLRGYALDSGYEIITLKNPYLPSLITDHLIIPELSLAFVRENGKHRFQTDTRRIHSRRFVSSPKLHNSRTRISFNKKLTKQLLSSAAEGLAAAKQTHDRLEKYYIDAMDFDSLSLFATKFCEDLFS